jgi:hypothetical protein
MLSGGRHRAGPSGRRDRCDRALQLTRPGRLQGRERDRAATLLASHFARTAFEVAELLQPGYDPAQLRAALADIGAEAPRRV